MGSTAPQSILRCTTLYLYIWMMSGAADSSISPSWSRKWPVSLRTAYVVLLSIPGVSIVTAAEFAGEMGPITNYANDQAITGRAGIYPSRYRATRSTVATALVAEPTASCVA